MHMWQLSGLQPGRVEACICCHEIEAVQNKNIEAVTSGECEEQPQCITNHHQ